MGEIFQSRGEVSARLHSLQYICRAKFASVQTQYALEHFRFLTFDTTWDLTVGCVYSAILCKRVNEKQVKGIFWSGPSLTSISSNFFSWIWKCCSLIVITLSGCFKTWAASGENMEDHKGQGRIHVHPHLLQFDCDYRAFSPKMFILGKIYTETWLLDISLERQSLLWL